MRHVESTGAVAEGGDAELRGPAWLEARRRDGEHVLEGVVTEMNVTDVSLAALHLDAHRHRAAAGVPHGAAGRLCGQHRDRKRIDQAVVAEVARSRRAPCLLVADEM